jgi:hypothetical protein
MNRIPDPVTPIDLAEWAVLTLRRDWRQYESPPRPLTWERVEQSLAPTIQRPVFVIGAPRSGTSFLGRCLEVLPELSYHFEPAATQRAALRLYFDMWSVDEAEQFYRIVYRWLLRLHMDGDLRYADKSPRNCFLVSFLRRAFPRARFVHILRDGRDAALSHSKKPWLQAEAAESREQGVGGHHFGPYARFYVEENRVDEFETTSNYHRCIWAWRRHVESALDAQEDLTAGQYHEVRYEHLVHQPVKEGRRLLNFLDISNSRSRNFFLRYVQRAHTDSVGKWHTELSDEQRQTAAKEAGDLLYALGYEGAALGVCDE